MRQQFSPQKVAIQKLSYTPLQIISRSQHSLSQRSQTNYYSPPLDKFTLTKYSIPVESQSLIDQKQQAQERRQRLDLLKSRHENFTYRSCIPSSRSPQKPFYPNLSYRVSQVLEPEAIRSDIYKELITRNQELSTIVEDLGTKLQTVQQQRDTFFQRLTEIEQQRTNSSPDKKIFTDQRSYFNSSLKLGSNTKSDFQLLNSTPQKNQLSQLKKDKDQLNQRNQFLVDQLKRLNEEQDLGNNQGSSLSAIKVDRDNLINKLVFSQDQVAKVNALKKTSDDSLKLILNDNYNLQEKIKDLNKQLKKNEEGQKNVKNVITNQIPNQNQVINNQSNEELYQSNNSQEPNQFFINKINALIKANDDLNEANKEQPKISQASITQLKEDNLKLSIKCESVELTNIILQEEIRVLTNPQIQLDDLKDENDTQYQIQSCQSIIRNLKSQVIQQEYDLVLQRKIINDGQYSNNQTSKSIEDLIDENKQKLITQIDSKDQSIQVLKAQIKQQQMQNNSNNSSPQRKSSVDDTILKPQNSRGGPNQFQSEGDTNANFIKQLKLDKEELIRTREENREFIYKQELQIKSKNMKIEELEQRVSQGQKQIENINADLELDKNILNYTKLYDVEKENQKEQTILVLQFENRELKESFDNLEITLKERQDQEIGKQVNPPSGTKDKEEIYKVRPSIEESTQGFRAINNTAKQLDKEVEQTTAQLNKTIEELNLEIEELRDQSQNLENQQDNGIQRIIIEYRELQQKLLNQKGQSSNLEGKQNKTSLSIEPNSDSDTQKLKEYITILEKERNMKNQEIQKIEKRQSQDNEQLTKQLIIIEDLQKNLNKSKQVNFQTGNQIAVEQFETALEDIDSDFDKIYAPQQSNRKAQSEYLPKNMTSSQLRSKTETKKLFREINQRVMMNSGQKSNRLDFTSQLSQQNSKSTIGSQNAQQSNN